MSRDQVQGNDAIYVEIEGRLGPNLHQEPWKSGKRDVSWLEFRTYAVAKVCPP